MLLTYFRLQHPPGGGGKGGAKDQGRGGLWEGPLGLSEGALLVETVTILPQQSVSIASD